MFVPMSSTSRASGQRRSRPAGHSACPAGVALALTVALAACQSATPTPHSPPVTTSTTAEPNPTVSITLPTSTSTYADRVEATISTPEPEELTVAAGSIWVRTHDEHVLRIDPKTNKIVARISLDQHAPGLHRRCFGIGNDGNTVWACVMRDEGAGIGQIDPKTNTISRYLPVGKAKEEMAFPANSRGLWVLTDGGSKLNVITPASGARTTYPLDARYGHVAADDSHLLVTSVPNGDVVLLDPATGAVTKRTTLNSPRLAALTSGDAWIDTADGLVRLGMDLQPKAVYPEILGLMWGDLLATDDSVWIREKDGAITHLDAATGKVLDRITPARALGAGNIMIAFGSIWATSEDDNQILRLRIE